MLNDMNIIFYKEIEIKQVVCKEMKPEMQPSDPDLSVNRVSKCK